MNIYIYKNVCINKLYRKQDLRPRYFIVYDYFGTLLT